MSISYVTVRDMLDHLRLWSGGGSNIEAFRRFREAINSAYRDIAQANRWSYLTAHDRLATNAPQQTGTVSYDHAGSTNEREVTISGSTFPTWANYGTIIISDIHYEIDQYIDATHVTLTETSNPGADVGSTTYKLYRDRYPLPTNFLFGARFLLHGNTDELNYVRPHEFFLLKQGIDDTGPPTHYTFLGDTDEPQRQMLRIAPYPDKAYQLDYEYQKQPSALLFDDHRVGTVTTALSATVTGTGTAWTSNMAGQILRISFSSSELGEDIQSNVAESFTAMQFPRPYKYERRIKSASASSITVDEALPEVLTNVKYIISSPIDLEYGVMLEAFLRAAEMECALRFRSEMTELSVAAYEQALEKAKRAEELRDLTAPLGDTATIHRQEAQLPGSR